VLSGLRVVELSAFVAAPLCGCGLASLGAEVVRIDPPGGGVDYRRWPLHNGISLYWNGLNQGKRSVTIDTRDARGRELVLSLVAKAGTCITNLPLDDWLTYDALRSRRPDIVYLRITGNPDGTPAVDYTVNAAVGFPMVTGPEDAAGPVNHLLPAWDVIASQMAMSAVIAAELRRARTGVGADIEISLANIGLYVASHLGYTAEAELALEPRQRYGNYVYGTFGRDFTTSDGRYVMIVAITPRQWRGLVAATATADAVAALERERGLDFTNESDRFACRRELGDIIATWVGAHRMADVAAAFDRARVLWGPYQTFQQLVREDPRARETNPLVSRLVQRGVGNVMATAWPWLNGSGSSVAPAPEMGEHTGAILRSWLGLSDADREELARVGVVAGTDG